MMPTTPRRRAFTLIELLVVVAIIALLAGLLIVVIGNVQRSARNTQDRGRLRALAQAANAYASSNKGRLPSPRTDTPSGWASMRKSCNAADTTVREDAANTYRGWVCAEEAACPGAIDSNCRETLLALERGSLYPYVDGPAAYLSSLDNTGRLRTFSQNAWVGVLYCDDYLPMLDKFKGGKYADACSLAFDTRTLSRIPQPANTFLYMPDNDGFKRTDSCPGWNFNGFCVNPNPDFAAKWFDVPGIFQTPQKQINLAFVDGSTGGYNVVTRKLEMGDIKFDPVNGAVDFTGDTKGDLQGLRNIALPGLIK